MPLRTPADNTAWLADVVGQLGLRRIHVVGWSYGGWLAFHYTMLNPEHVASLTLVDPANTLARFSRRFRTRFFALPAAAMAGGRFDPLIDRYTSWMLGDPDPADPAMARYLPILELLPDRDSCLPARRRPVPELELWPTATHALPAEHPDDVDQRILGFIERCT